MSTKDAGGKSDDRPIRQLVFNIVTSTVLLLVIVYDWLTFGTDPGPEFNLAYGSVGVLLSILYLIYRILDLSVKSVHSIFSNVAVRLVITILLVFIAITQYRENFSDTSSLITPFLTTLILYNSITLAHIYLNFDKQ